MKKALQVLLKVFLAIVAVVAAISLGVALWLGAGLPETFAVFLFFGGLLLMIFSGLVGAGFGERALYRSNLYIMTGSYRNAVTRERPQRRDEEFQFMIVGFLLGLGLLGVSLLLSAIILG
ncbi:MAG: hypothetical protein ACE5IJ_11440 [Thermoplasmata archaeon]